MFAKGSSLIEVLVAGLILGTGILCLLTLQASAVGLGVISGHRQQASLLLLELAELSYISPGVFRDIDPALFIADDIAAGVSSPVCPAGSVCLPEVFMLHELRAWARAVTDRLPDARLDIQREWLHGHMVWTVSLRWHGPQDFSQNSMQSVLQL